MRNFDPTKPVQTRDGRKARIVATNAAPSNIIALVLEESGAEFPHIYRQDGTWISAGDKNQLDLVNIPEKFKYWINIYYEGYPTIHGHKFEATLNRKEGCAACICVEFEEGEGLC